MAWSDCCKCLQQCYRVCKWAVYRDRRTSTDIHFSVCQWVGSQLSNWTNCDLALLQKRNTHFYFSENKIIVWLFEYLRRSLLQTGNIFVIFFSLNNKIFCCVSHLIFNIYHVAEISNNAGNHFQYILPWNKWQDFHHIDR